MASNEAIALISGGSAVLGGLIGATAGHFTTIRSQKLQAELEHERQRQVIYRDFLGRVHEFMQAAGNVDPKDDAGWAAWFQDFENDLNAVLLLGKEKPRLAAAEIQDVIEEVLEATGAAAGTTPSERRQAGYLEHEDTMIVAFDRAVVAMRSDVGVRG